MKWIIFAGLLLSHFWLYADYLVVSRSATIKENPEREGRILVRVGAGDYLVLRDDISQTNGYYYVQIPDSDSFGWIYRTLARRYRGDIPGSIAVPIYAQDVKINVIDVGPGLCTVIQLPGDKYIVYDAGHWRGYGNTTYEQIKEHIPVGKEIELVVLSHTDSDHIGAAGQILTNYRVKTLLRTGFEKSMISNESQTGTYKRLINALGSIHYDINDVNLNRLDSVITPGTTLKYGDVNVVLLCGFGEPLDTWGLSSRGELLNSVSIVMKVEFKGSSVLLAGDAVGRHIGSPSDALIATEEFLVNNASDFLDADIIIAPHHGADNGSSTAFLDLVTPEIVVFSAGHDHDHPTNSAAQRYLRHAEIYNIYRTDRGDDERDDSDYYEWPYGRIDGCQDSYGDDDVEILLKRDRTYSVKYLNDIDPCSGSN